MRGRVWRWAFGLCLAFLGGLPAAAFGDPPDMTFQAVPLQDPATCAPRCAHAIEARGTIRRGTPQVFAQFLRDNEPAMRAGQLRSVVLIDSPGGEVAGSMLLGMMFRELGVTVIVGRSPRAAGADRRRGMDMTVAAGTCYSACVYALVGGRARVVPPVSRVGVHEMHRRADIVAQMFEGRPEVSPATRGAVASLDQYIRRMGVSPDLVALAQSVPHDRIHRLSERELRRYRVVAGRP
jgi:hypothetical protein